MPRKPSPTLPPSATRSALLPGGSDRLFRELLYAFFTVATRLEQIRHYLGARIGLSGPQYTLLMAVAELQGASGVSVGRAADYLHVTGTFVTAESRKLSAKRLLNKRPEPRDGRVVRLSIAPKGQAALESLFPELQRINDSFFDLASREEFGSLHGVLKRMVATSKRTLTLVRTLSENTGGRT